MKDIETEEAKEVGKDQSAKVQVTVVYTATAKEKKFQAETTATLASVIDTAYDRLKEERRPGDRYFCSEEPRHDLAPHLSQTLRQMHKAGVCVKEKNRNKLEFEFDIDSDIGGAAL